MYMATIALSLRLYIEAHLLREPISFAHYVILNMKLHCDIALSVSALGLLVTLGGSTDLMGQVCSVTATATPNTVPCGGGNVNLNAVGTGGTTFALNNDFNLGGAGTGWVVSPAGVFNNPCGPSLDGTTYMWMGNTTAAPRTLQSAPLDVSCGGQICFDFKMAIQGGASPCEGPDLTNEGVYLQWSLDAVTWTDINYFQPNTAGSTNSQTPGSGNYTAWTNYCYAIPLAAQTAATYFRWFQTGSSGTCCDHWGIDNVTITSQSCQAYYYDWGVDGTSDPAAQNGIFVGADTTFTVIYTNGVSDTCYASVTVTVSGMGVPTVVPTPETCDGFDDGTITVTPNGGVGPYQYTLTGPGGPYTNATGIFTGLPDGTFSVSVLDQGSACTANQGNIVVAQGAICCPSPITYVPLINDLNCWNDASGSMQITPGGGDGGPYNISFDGGTTFTNNVMLDSITGQQALTLNIQITDNSGCVLNTTETISQPPQMGLNLTSTNLNCWNSCDGTANVVAYGGVGPYQFNWNGQGMGSVTNPVSMCSGNHDLQVMDSHGCLDDTLNWNITVPLPFTVTTSTVNSNCGQADGSASVDNVTGAGGIYSYLWDANAGNQVTAVATNLSSGSYCVTIADQYSCDTTICVTVGNTNSSFVVTTSSINAHCGTDDGSATVDNVMGGLGPYGYLWDANAGNQITATASNLVPGSYCVTISDQYSCDTTVCVTVGNTNSAFVVTSSSINSNCNMPDGSATIDNVTGGLGPYLYLWDANAGNQTTAAATGLVPGNYCVTITDAYTCDTTICVTVGLNAGHTAQLIGTVDALCFQSADGTAEVSTVGGTAPFSYQWDANAGNQTDSLAVGLGAGQYTCVITDANGCLDQITVTVGEPTQVNVLGAGDTTICENGSAVLSATSSGGTPGYSYQWDDPNSSTTQSVSVSPGGVTVYNVTVTDANGCVTSPYPVVVQILPPLQVTALSDQDICPGDAASISAIAQGGDGNYTYVWDQGVGNGQLQNVSPGATTTYTVTADDGCESTPVGDQVTITVNAIPTVLFSATPLEGCMPVTSTFSNDTDPNMIGSVCLWDFGDGNFSSDCAAPSNTYQNPGCYDVSLMVTSPDGCVGTATQPSMICVHDFPIADFEFGPQPTTIANTEITFVNLSSGGATYEWLFGFQGELGYATTENGVLEFPFDEPGSYPVCLKTISDQGCADSTCKTVVIEGEFFIYAPNAFTPDGDGLNDFFYPSGVGIDESKFDFFVFDRWGQIVHESHSPNKPWDGRYKGEYAPQDVYVWKVITRDLWTGDPKEVTGHVTVLR